MGSHTHRRSGYAAAFLAACVFGGLAATPWLYNSGRAAQPAHAAIAPPLSEPHAPPAASLGAAFRPLDLNGARASLPARANPSVQSAAVLAEDRRIELVLRHSARLVRPSLLTVQGEPSTLVLPPRRAGYTAADLIAAGVLLPQPDRAMLLVGSVLVAPRAKLALASPMLTTLLMASGPRGFTSIVAWGATLQFSGAGLAAPLKIRGWDLDTSRATADQGGGRPYIRAIASRMDLHFVDVSSLGFSTGRTGGVAWTGTRTEPSSGGADFSRFTGNTYGAFLSRTEHAKFANDLFESNEVDGIRVHRNAVASRVVASTAARNGGNGFAVGRGATNTHLTGNLSVNNAGNGYLLDGRLLASGAVPRAQPANTPTGIELSGSGAENNGHAGIVVEGGVGTLIDGNSVCAPSTAIAVRGVAAGTVLTGNEVGCASRTALSIATGVSATTITSNRFSNANIGILIRSSSGVRVNGNVLTGITVMGISLRGATVGVVGDDNTISGRGFRAVDVRSGTATPAFSNTDASGWVHRKHGTAIGFLRYHPILLIWVSVFGFVALTSAVARLRRRPRPLYSHKIGGSEGGVIAGSARSYRQHPSFDLTALVLPQDAAVAAALAGGEFAAGAGRPAAPT